MGDKARNQLTGRSNETDYHSKQTKIGDIIIKNERKVIGALFLRSLETLRFMSTYGVELRGTIVEKASEEFVIKKNSVNHHVDRVLELKFFSLEEDGKIYKNNKLFEWL